MSVDSSQLCETETRIEPRWHDSILGFVCLLLIIGWAVVFGYSIHAALPLNPINLPLEESVKPRVWVPQGWKFFTRSPREDVISVFARQADGGWANALHGPNGSPSNLFGISRATRAQGIEIGILQVAVSRLEWHSCKAAVEQCVEQAPIVPVPIRIPLQIQLSVVNSVSPYNHLCRGHGVVREEKSPCPQRQ